MNATYPVWAIIRDVEGVKLLKSWCQRRDMSLTLKVKNQTMRGLSCQIVFFYNKKKMFQFCLIARFLYFGHYAFSYDCAAGNQMHDLYNELTTWLKINFLKCISCFYTLGNCTQYKVSKDAKIRNRYNQVPHLTHDTNGKVTNSQPDTTNESSRFHNLSISGNCIFEIQLYI